ncbi:CopD family protein [Methyloraptor flagellatus]|uniref:Protoporphyrinogen IX oxidase n=1 Tax=Methyloraptor flagellatus TaxID=3162530 RepID=A0AAU7X7J9_9HYPH
MTSDLGSIERDRSPARRAAIAIAVTVVLFGALVLWNPAGLYNWMKALHVIAVIAWMAGMLYLPRLFVNHVGLPIGSAESELLKGMERRLLRIIVNPAMIVTWVVGAWLVWQGEWWRAPWFHGKFALVLILSALHGHFSAAVRAFGEDRNAKTARYWRIMNEMPALCMIGIVILVIVKPF